MRILWHSNAPWCGTGYGQQTALTIPLLREQGHEIAVSAFYGLQGAPMNWEGFTVYPGGAEGYGNDVLPSHALHWLQGNAAGGAVITLCDAWVIRAAALRFFTVGAWAPVDHDPVPPDVLAFFTRNPAALPIAMSRYGEAKFREAGLDPVYVPHGVDTRLFRPDTVDQKTARQLLQLPEDAFVIGMVAANKGVLPCRKSFPQVFEAFAQFSARHSDALLYLHSEQLGAHIGIDLQKLAEAYGVAARTRFVDQYALRLGIPTDAMPTVYRAFDVLANPAMGEGFGVPIVEAQACFPAATEVSAAGVTAAMERRYTGDLIRIETDRGDVIEATAEHPFWTDRGWVTAEMLTVGGHQLLYTGGYAQTQHVHAGRLGDLVAALRDDAPERGGAADGALVRVGALAQASDGDDEAVLSDSPAVAGDLHVGATRLHGRADRRRGHCLDPQSAAPLEALHSNSQYLQATHGLAVSGVPRTLDLHREAPSEAFGQAYLLHVPLRGLGVSAALRGAAAPSRDQANTDGVRDRVRAGTAHPEPHGSPESPPVGTDPMRARPQYQALRSVSRRAVRDLPVYNLSTRSGTYLVAGYLVHNCGIPVIVTGFSAMDELVGAGWKVEYDRWWDPAQSAWLAYPKPGSILDCFEAAYENRGRSRLAKRAVTFARSYDARRLARIEWVEALSRLEARLPSKAEPANLAEVAQAFAEVAP